MSTQAVELSIGLQSVDLLQFDVLEVWRSRDTAGGPYEPLTSAGSTPARLPSGAPGRPASPQAGPLINANGKQLLFTIGSTTFAAFEASGTDPMNYGQLASQIQAWTLGEVNSYVVGGLLVLETREVGGHARLEVMGGDIAGLTGLALNTPAFGHESYVPLIANQIDYTFIDQQGSSSFWYEWRLRNSLQDEVSEFSAPFQPSRPRVVDTVIGYVDLTDMDGAALEAREVRLYSRFNGQLSNGRVVAGYAKNALTDKNGHVEFVLVCGLPITVAIAGTELVRDLIVPADPMITRFNLLDPSLGTNDVFKVQVPNISYATRRSL